MPIDHQFLEQPPGVEAVGRGRVTGAEILESCERVLEHERMPGRRYKLFDLSAAEDFDVSSDDVHRIVAVDEAAAKRFPGLAVAIVVATDVAFGMARMWKALLDQTDWTTAVFRSRDEAEVWLARRLEEHAGD